MTRTHVLIAVGAILAAHLTFRLAAAAGLVSAAPNGAIRFR